MSIIDSFDFIGCDERTRKYILPKRIVCSAGRILNPGSLLKKKSLQIGLNETDLTWIERWNNEPTYIVLDYGCEIHGGIRIINYSAFGGSDQNVRLTFGESLSEVMSNIDERGSSNDHAMRDFTVSVPDLSDQEWGQTGFRFVKLELLKNDTKLAIKSLPAVFVYRDLEYRGSFRCSDPKLNKIFDTAAYTCHLNLQSLMWDGIKRDRLVWAGDMHPEMLTVRSVFGPQDIIAQSLDFVKEQNQLPLFVNGMASYSMWWIIIAWDYYFYSGDKSFIEGEREYILPLIKMFCDMVNVDGSDSIGNYFLDWPTHDNPEAEISGVRGLLKVALEKGALAAEYFNERGLANEAKEKALLIAKNPGNHNGRKQAAAFMCMAGMLSPEKCAEVIKAGGAKGMSSYLLFYILKELSRTDTNAALDILRDYGFGMLDKGATTFWEDFDPDWAENTATITEIPENGLEDIHGDRGAYCYKGFRHSLCHGWASGAVPFLMEEIMGVHILDAGCASIEIKPKMGDLDYIDGVYPTPHGDVSIHIKKVDGKPEINFEAPEGINVII